MQHSSCTQRLFHNPKHVQWVSKERLLIRNSDPVLFNCIRSFGRFAAFKKPQQHRFRFGMRRLKRGQKDAGQLADFRGMAKVILHKVLNSTSPTVVFIAKPFRNLDLHIKGQLIHCPICRNVQMAADRP